MSNQSWKTLPLLSGSQSAVIREGTSILPENLLKLQISGPIHTYRTWNSGGTTIWVSTNPPGTSQVMPAPIYETETIRDDWGPQRCWNPGFCISEQLSDGSSVHSPESRLVTTALGTPEPTEHYILSREKSAQGCVVQALSRLTDQVWILISWLSMGKTSLVSWVYISWFTKWG